MNADRASLECIQNKKITDEDCRFTSEEWDIVDFSFRVWKSWPKLVVYSHVSFVLFFCLCLWLLVSWIFAMAANILDNQSMICSVYFLRCFPH